MKGLQSETRNDRNKVLLAANLKSARTRIKITQLELSLRTDISTAAISRYENGARSPDLWTLKKLSEGLETSMERLLGWDPGSETGNDRIQEESNVNSEDPDWEWFVSIREEMSDFSEAGREFLKNTVEDALRNMHLYKATVRMTNGKT